MPFHAVLCRAEKASRHVPEPAEVITEAGCPPREGRRRGNRGKRRSRNASHNKPAARSSTSASHLSAQVEPASVSRTSWWVVRLREVDIGDSTPASPPPSSSSTASTSCCCCCAPPRPPPRPPPPPPPPAAARAHCAAPPVPPRGAGWSAPRAGWAAALRCGWRRGWGAPGAAAAAGAGAGARGTKNTRRTGRPRRLRLRCLRRLLLPPLPLPLLRRVALRRAAKRTVDATARAHVVVVCTRRRRGLWTWSLNDKNEFRSEN